MPGTKKMKHQDRRSREGPLSPQLCLGLGGGEAVGAPQWLAVINEQVLHRNIVTCSAASKPHPQFIYGPDLFLLITEFSYMK